MEGSRAELFKSLKDAMPMIHLPDIPGAICKDVY